MTPIVEPRDDVSNLAGAAVAKDKLQSTRHTCFCGRSFIRKEHLRRHQASHGARSYICHICQRSFNRNDVLRRHINRHSTTAPPDSRRGRACDACYANKTKCDGGKRCSLCAKRDIDCKYDREVGVPLSNSGLETNDSENASSSLGLASQCDLSHLLTPMNLQNNVDGTTFDPYRYKEPSFIFTDASPDNTLLSESGNPDESHMQPEPRSVKTLIQALITAPAGSEELDKVFQHIDKVIDGDNKHAPEIDDDNTINQSIAQMRHEWRALDTVRTLSNTYSKLYFSHFHPRWPILHAPGYDEATDPFVITASVAMIGSWIEGSRDSRETALTIHDRLMNHLFRKVYQRVPNEGRGRAWPIKTFQATLLNIIFAFYSGQDHLISRALMLRSLFIVLLRELGLFCSDMEAYQENNHFTGSFVPYVMVRREERKRISLMLFKIDSYFSLLRGQPATLYYEEMYFKLPCTFALYNSHGLFMFYKRQPEEPSDRGEVTTSIMIDDPQALNSSPFLIEDIHLGLCGMQPSVWKYTEMRYRGLVSTSQVVESKDLLQNRLSAWKQQLDTSASLLSKQIQSHQGNEPLPYPLMAYLGSETVEKPDFMSTVSLRISASIIDTTLLYHLLSTHLCASIRSLTILAGIHYGPCPMHSVACPSSAEQEDSTRAWVHTSDARRSVWHAASAMSAYGKYEKSDVVDPIANVTLAAAALVVWAYVFYYDGPFSCSTVTNHTDGGLELIELNDNLELENWLKEDGPASVEGVRLCKCNMELLVGKFTETSRSKDMGWEWEMGGVLAPMLKKE